jgi:omega-amidase
MKVALVQTVLVWENAEANRSHFADLIGSIKESVDLIVLPEMFSTGFTMQPNGVAEEMQGETVNWMQSMAAKSQSAICGSVVAKDENNFYNRLIFVEPSGKLSTYDKHHLFTLAGEDKIYKAGTERRIIDYKGFKICPLVCYDLRFPVFSRNTEDYDLLIYVANWPKPRVNAWDILLRARAVENMCYVVGVNRIGSDDNGLEYVGHSQAVDFLGNYLVEPQENTGIFIVELPKETMLETRKKLAFLNDRDPFTLG